MDSKYVVIGAGLAGAATAWQLARTGHEVTLVERTRPATSDGSSHGSARIFRYPYPDRLYTELVVRAPGRVRRTGGRFRAAADHPDRRAGLRFGTQPACPGSGAGRRRRGARTSSRSGLRASASLEAERVVIAAGGWLPTLLDRLPSPAGFRTSLPKLEVSQENAFQLPYADPQQIWPTFIHEDSSILTYGLPSGRDAQFRGLKMAEFSAGRRMPSAVDQDGAVDPAARELAVAHVRRYLPASAFPRVSWPSRRAFGAPGSLPTTDRAARAYGLRLWIRNDRWLGACRGRCAPLGRKRPAVGRVG